ncbi:MAG: universal stress protein [Actinobacteria bacterium]|nr:MAG: universal stress protein [Actinomycetota bacterium]
MSLVCCTLFPYLAHHKEVKDTVKVCIKGPAEDVRVGEISEVCLAVDRILLATDGSEPSVLATQYAVTLAKTFDAEVRAIFVDTGVEALEYPEEELSDEVIDDLHPSVKGLVIAKTMCDRNDVPCDVEVIRGGVAKRIVATAEEYGADLIVLGDTGRTGLKRIALGSVAETVVKGSHIPVLVAKDGHGAV